MRTFLSSLKRNTLSTKVRSLSERKAEAKSWSAIPKFVLDWVLSNSFDLNDLWVKSERKEKPHPTPKFTL